MPAFVTLSTFRSLSQVPLPDSSALESIGDEGTHFPFYNTEQETLRLIWDPVLDASITSNGTLIIPEDPSGFWHIESPIMWEAPLFIQSVTTPSIIDEVTASTMRVYTYNHTWTMTDIGTFDDAVNSDTGEPLIGAPIDAVFHLQVSMTPGKYAGRVDGVDQYWPEIEISLECTVQLRAPYVSADAPLPPSPPRWRSIYTGSSSDYYSAHGVIFYLPPAPGTSIAEPDESLRIMRSGVPSGMMGIVTDEVLSIDAAPDSFLEIAEFKWWPSASYQARGTAWGVGRFDIAPEATCQRLSSSSSISPPKIQLMPW